MHADVSSAAAEIYAASVALSEMCYLSYISDEMGMAIGLPFVLQVDNSTCLAFSKDQVQRSKLRHIDCRQEWVLALRDADVVRLEWVESASNFADLFTKILEAETFLRLRDQLMEFEPIPTAGRGGAGKVATTGSSLNVHAAEFKPAARAGTELRFDLRKNEFIPGRSREEREVHFDLAKNEFFPGMSRASCDEPEEAIRKNPNNRLSSRTVRNFITRGVLGSGQKGRAPPQ